MECLSHEQDFVCAAVRRSFGQVQTTPIDPTIDWSLVVEMIGREGLGSLVYSGLGDLADGVPDEVRKRLQLEYFASLVRIKAWLDPMLRKVLEVFGSLDLDPIILKGAALAYSTYPTPAHRTMSDVDILLPPEQIGRATEALYSIGFQNDGVTTPAPHHPPTFYQLGTPFGIELHRQLIPAPNPFSLDLDRFRARSQTVDVAGAKARVLDPSDALLYTCAHLSYTHRYRWHPLRALTDILSICLTYASQLNWDAFIETVRYSHTAGAVYWPLLLSETWLTAPIPAEVMSTIAGPTSIQKLMRSVAVPSYVLSNRPIPSDGDSVLDNLIVELSLRGGCSRREQVGSVLSSLFPPRATLGHLPNSLSQSRSRYALYLVRPRRVVHGVTALGRILVHLAGVPVGSNSS